MAFLGDFGKIFLGGARTGDVVSAITGSSALGTGAQRVSDLISKVPVNRIEPAIGGTTAVSQAPLTMPQENANSGTSGNFLGFSDEIGGGFAPVFDSQQAFNGRMQAQQAGVPAIIGQGLAAGRSALGFLFGGAAGMAAPLIIDQIKGVSA